MPKKHRLIDVASLYRGNHEEFVEALHFAGDLLVLRRFGDGFTGVEEFVGRRRIAKTQVLDEQADIIEENFLERGGVVKWK